MFGSLGVGNYTYCVQARAENNGQQTVQAMIEHAFTVGAAESQQTEPALTSVGYNMTVNVGKGWPMISKNSENQFNGGAARSGARMKRNRSKRL